MFQLACKDSQHIPSGLSNADWKHNILFIWWFEFSSTDGNSGWRARCLHKIKFLPNDDLEGHVFGFLDPNKVIWMVHTIPDFSLDCTKELWVNPMLISDVVRLSGTYLILLIKIRLYLCRLDYIFYCTYRLGYPYCPSSLGRLIVLSLLFSLGTFLLFPNELLSCITIDGLDLVSRTFCRVQ